MNNKKEINNKKEMINKLLSDSKFRERYIHPRKHSMSSTLRWIYKPILSNKKVISSSIIFAILNGIIPIISIYTIYYITWIISEKNLMYSEVVINIVILIVSLFLASVISIDIENKTYSIFTNVRMNMTKNILDKYMSMDFGLFDNAEFLDDLGNWNRSLQGNKSGVEGVYHCIYGLLGKVVSFIILSILMVRISIYVPLLALCYLVLYNFTGMKLGNFELKYRKKLDSISRKFGVHTNIGADFRYGKELRIYKIKEKLISKSKELHDEYAKQNKEMKRHKFFITLPNLILLGAIFGFVIITIMYKSYNGYFTISEMILFLTSATVYIQILEEVLNSILFIRSEAIYIGEMIDLYEVDLSFEKHSQYERIDSLFELEFQDVSFRYPNSEKLVINKFSIKICSGEKIALVGLNGAGKSTLVKLIIGLYEPTSGTILLNGKNINLYSHKARYEFFATVFQNPEPLAMTVAENVTCTNEYDRERLEMALKSVGLYNKVYSRKANVETNLLKVFDDEGMIMSGGENQKLAIARAFYRKYAKFIILDEPTSALDSMAERDFYDDVNKIFNGKTVLFISHRLASTKFCDRIILLDDGGASEVGTHVELIKLKGKYYMMYEKQSENYIKNSK